MIAVNDITPPTTVSSFNPTSGADYNANQPVTLTATDNAGGPGSRPPTTRSTPGAVTYGRHVHHQRRRDAHVQLLLGRLREQHREATHVSHTFRIDTVAPVTMSSFNPATGANYNATQTVTLTASDTGGSGVKATYYKVDSGAVTTYTAPFTISGDATHTFIYYSVDNANNTETAHVSNVFRIDTIAPSTTSNFNPATNANYNATQR